MSSSISGTLSTLITATSSHLWNFGQLRQSLKTLCGSEPWSTTSKPSFSKKPVT